MIAATIASLRADGEDEGLAPATDGADLLFDLSAPVAAPHGGGSIPYIMTAVVVTAIPTILLFVLLQPYFIKGMTLSVADG